MLVHLGRASLARAFVLCVVAACTGDPSGPVAVKDDQVRKVDGPILNMTPEGCEILPEQCPSRYPPDQPLPDFAGNLHNFNRATGLNEPTSPVDPFPGTEGIWLNLYPEDCWATFYRVGSSHPDLDADGLDDNCELRLAQAFAPMLRFSSGEDCPGGEAYWGAKFFDDWYPYNTGNFVRIAYLMAYYMDCGTGGHTGDSEFIQLRITFVGATKHWKLVDSWISAHASDGLVGANRSTWGNVFEWPSGRKYSYPRIYVAENKHAHYRSSTACTNGADTCNGFTDAGRFRVWSGNNIGNFHKPLKNCVASMKNALSPVECFWSGTDFGGWRNGTPSSSPYKGYLNTMLYGCYLMSSGTQWCSRWGI
jgi:hypothetical protein